MDDFWYLMYEDCGAGVPIEWHGITRHVATMKRYQHQFTVRHEGCEFYSAVDHECVRCDKRFVVETIKEAE